MLTQEEMTNISNKPIAALIGMLIAYAQMGKEEAVDTVSEILITRLVELKVPTI